MKTIKMVLEGIFWPVTVLILGNKAKTLLGDRIVFSAMGIFNVLLLIVAFWLAMYLYPASVKESYFLSFWQ